MSQTSCGYELGRLLPDGTSRMGVASFTGRRIIHVLSANNSGSAIDVGRTPSGELLWILEPGAAPLEEEASTVNSVAILDQVTTPAVPLSKLFAPVEYNPPPSAAEPILPPQPSNTTPAMLPNWLMTVFAQIKSWTVARPKVLAVGAGAFIVFLVVVFTLPPANGAKTALAPVAVAEPQPSIDPAINDPQSASIDFAMAGQLPALGIVSGLPRSAFTSVVTSRAGDIVLLDVYVTKASGHKTFATVLLQKSGTQWRMREVFEPKS